MKKLTIFRSCLNHRGISLYRMFIVTTSLYLRMLITYMFPSLGIYNVIRIKLKSICLCTCPSGVTHACIVPVSTSFYI
jgi:hypothetical protein